MWTSLLSTISKVNNALFNEFKQKLDCGIKQKSEIQSEAEKDFYNELNQMCKDTVIKLKHNNGDDRSFKRHKLMEAHIKLIQSIEESFRRRVLQTLNGLMSKQDALLKELNEIGDEHNLWISNTMIKTQFEMNGDTDQQPLNQQSIEPQPTYAQPPVSSFNIKQEQLDHQQSPDHAQMDIIQNGGNHAHIQGKEAKETDITNIQQ